LATIPILKAYMWYRARNVCCEITMIAGSHVARFC
jgi:hypothetical protein